MRNRYKNTRTNNIIIAEQSFIGTLPDVHENLGEASPVQETTFEEVQTQMLSGVVAQATNQYNEALKVYSTNEQATFPKQETEYEAWVLDNTSPTPTVDRLANARGVDRLVLLPKIGLNIISRDSLTGQQQAVEDLIKACTTIEELQALQN